MGERLQELIDRYEELTRQLMDPDLLADGRRYEQVARAQAALRPIVEHIRAGERLDRELADARQLAQEADDPDLKALAQEEVERLTKAREAWELELRKLLIPKDPNDERNVLVEIRAGAGGEDAALFAADLLRMYTRYAERHGWRGELMSSTPRERGGLQAVSGPLPGRRRGRGGGPLRGRPAPHVRPLRGAAGLAGGADEQHAHGAGGLQRGDRPALGPGRLQPAQVRKRRPPGAAGPHHRVGRPDPHLHGHRGRPARGGGGGRGHRPAGSPDRHLPGQRSWGPER